MSGHFIQDWASLYLALALGFAPFSAVMATNKAFNGPEYDDAPGCVVALAGLLFLAGPVLAYFWFQNFAVVAR